MASKSPFFTLHQHSAEKACKIAKRVTSLAIQQLADSSKMGGYFCLLDIQTGSILVTTIIGTVNSSKALKYKQLAEEKALRLHHLHIFGGSVISSYQSRNEEEEKWGGAVLGERFIYSFSGLPELHDECISLSIASVAGDIPTYRAEEIMSYSATFLGIHPTAHPARPIIAALAA